MNGLISDAWAQAAPGAPSQFTPLLMVAVFFVIFYFLLFRPQQKRAKEHQNLISKLATGDEVVTTGGILGKVTEIGQRNRPPALLDASPTAYASRCRRPRSRS